MRATLELQRRAFTASLPEPLTARADRVDRALALLLEHKDDFAAAASADFGSRSVEQTLLTDYIPSVEALRFAKANLKRWTRDETRRPILPLWLLGGRARVVFQPKGVVGILAPWNFPVGMHCAVAGGENARQGLDEPIKPTLPGTRDTAATSKQSTSAALRFTAAPYAASTSR